MAQVVSALLPDSDSNWKVGKTTRSFRYDLNQIPHNYTVEVTNRFKGLDLIDKVPEELWMEVHDIVQEAVIKNISKERNANMQMVVWGGLTNSWEKRSKDEEAKEKRKDIPIWMYSSKEQKGEIRKPKPLTVWITKTGKSFKRWEYQPPDQPPDKSVCRSRSNS